MRLICELILQCNLGGFHAVIIFVVISAALLVRSFLRKRFLILVRLFPDISECYTDMVSFVRKKSHQHF